MRLTVNILLAFTLTLVFSTAIAQTTLPITPKPAPRNEIAEDTNRVFYDENDKPIRFYQAMKLLNGGEYNWIEDNSPGGKRRVYKMSMAEQVAAYERTKTFLKIRSEQLKEGQKLDIMPLLGVLDRKNLDNKVIVFVFWFSFCPPCTESFDALNDFFKQVHNPDNIVILSITNDDKSRAEAKLAEKPLYYAQLITNAGRITSAYGLKNAPAFIVTDRDHIIHFAVAGIGPAVIAAFKNAIRTVLIQ
jgi:thiol-disulfide isomerase/thioredoxin